MFGRLVSLSGDVTLVAVIAEGGMDRVYEGRQRAPVTSSVRPCRSSNTCCDTAPGPPFALERLSVTRGPDGRIARVRYVLPRHKAANRAGLGAVGEEAA